MSAIDNSITHANSKFLEALEALGCAIKQESLGSQIRFRYQGGNYLSAWSKAGDALCVVYPCFLEVSSFANVSDANAAVHELNAEVAIARVFISDGELCASAETYISDEMDIERLFVKLIGVIQGICIQMRAKRELSVSTQVKPAGPAQASSCVDSGMAVH